MTGAGPALLQAIRTRATAARRGGILISPVVGGTHALVRRGDTRRLVSILPSDGQLPSTGLGSWLGRLQARRSLLLIAPDRGTAVAFALAWRLDPQRVRLVSQPERVVATDLEDAVRAAGRKDRAWHSR